MHEASAVGLRGVGKRRVRAAQRDRAGDAAPPEVRPHPLGRIEREHAHGDVRVGIVEPARDEASFLDHVDDRARAQPGGRFLEGAPEHPRMACPQVARQILLQLELYRLHGPSCLPPPALA